MEKQMVDNEPLILDFIEWLSREPRTYAETMDAWRTSCPRLTVWEDAMDRGFVVRQARSGKSHVIAVTDEGIAFLRARRPGSASIEPVGFTRANAVI